jgi:hypothetical protein
MSSGVVALAGEDEVNATTAAVVLVPIAVFGAVAAKGWVLVLPTLWSALYLAVLRIADLISGACSVCSSDEDWGNYPFFFFCHRGRTNERRSPSRPDHWHGRSAACTLAP